MAKAVEDEQLYEASVGFYHHRAPKDHSFVMATTPNSRLMAASTLFAFAHDRQQCRSDRRPAQGAVPLP